MSLTGFTIHPLPLNSLTDADDKDNGVFLKQEGDPSIKRAAY